MASALVMLVMEDLQTQQALASALTPRGFASVLASSAQEAVEILKNHRISLVFCSDELPDGEIHAFIRQRQRHEDRVPVVVVSRLDDWERYLDYLSCGAFDYLLYPFAFGEVDRIVSNASNVPDLVASGSLQHLKPIGLSPQRSRVQACLRQIRRFSGSDDKTRVRRSSQTVLK
jgi:DNA-binding NtrC family response regulator